MLRLFKSIGLWPSVQRENVKTLLLNNLYPIKVSTDSCIYFPVNDMYRVEKTLVDNGYPIVDLLPNNIWKHICRKIELVSPLLISEQVGPELWNTLYPYQREAVEKCISFQKSCNYSEMGVGKTASACCVAQYFQGLGSTLIICPSILRYTWATELKKWLKTNEKDIVIIKTGKDVAKVSSNHKFVIVSYHLVIQPAVVSSLLARKFPIAIADEFHYVKSLGSKRSASTVRLLQNAQIRMGLTGTPFSYPSGLFPQIRAMYPDLFPHFFGHSEPGICAFADRYCKPHLVMMKGKSHWEFKGYDRTEELNTILKTFTVRHLKKDVLSQLPPKLRSCITLPPLKKKIPRVFLNYWKKKMMKNNANDSCWPFEKPASLKFPKYYR